MDISVDAKIIITPIAKKYKKHGEPDSRRDFEDQMRRHEEGAQLMWDDSPMNSAKVGDIFGFTLYKDRVQFHIITEIYPIEYRLPLWYSNIGQGDRQVLYLSPPIYTMSWETWLSAGGHKRIMGTTIVKSARSLMLYCLKTEMRKLQIQQMIQSYQGEIDTLVSELQELEEFV